MLRLLCLYCTQKHSEIVRARILCYQSIDYGKCLLKLFIVGADHSFTISRLDVVRVELQALIVVEAGFVYLIHLLIAHGKVVQKCLMNGFELGSLRFDLRGFFC